MAYADDVNFLTEIEKKKPITLKIANKTLKKDNLTINETKTEETSIKRDNDQQQEK